MVAPVLLLWRVPFIVHISSSLRMKNRASNGKVGCRLHQAFIKFPVKPLKYLLRPDNNQQYTVSR